MYSISLASKMFGYLFKIKGSNGWYDHIELKSVGI